MVAFCEYRRAARVLNLFLQQSGLYILLCEKHTFKWLLGLSFVEFKTLKKRERRRRRGRGIPDGCQMGRTLNFLLQCLCAPTLIYGLVSFSVSPQKFQRRGVIPELAILDINSKEEENTHARAHTLSEQKQVSPLSRRLSDPSARPNHPRARGAWH